VSDSLRRPVFALQRTLLQKTTTDPGKPWSALSDELLSVANGGQRGADGTCAKSLPTIIFLFSAEINFTIYH
jgi:hypothetical protein